MATTTPDRGCLIIADVAGYTDYLMGTELDHAEDVLADLMETVVGGLQPTFRVSKLEGDAAFGYAVADRIEASMLLDTVDVCYFAFRARLRDIDRATTCDCNACVLIPDLDLKIVVHHGNFARRVVAGNEELTGRDVIVVHRLLKNGIQERLGVRGYALLTEPCVQAMDVDPRPLGYVPHHETYDGVGEVRGFVGDLHARWEADQERHRVYVLAEGAGFDVTLGVLPYPPEVLWEYLTAPEKRALWAADRVDQVAGGARRGAGTVTHCVHGKDVIVERILDWRPFRYYTVATEWPGVGEWPWTWELEPVEGGTALRVRGRGFTGHRSLLTKLYRRWKLDAAFEHGFDGLTAALERDVVPV